MAGEKPSVATEPEVEVDVQEQRKAKEKELNASRTGKGTRVKIGATRGKNSQEIQYEAFDESLTDTLPVSVDEFMSLTGVNDEKVLLGYLIDGFNAANYTAASDPVAEFIEPTWDDETKKQFRLVVRNYASGAGVSLDDAVKLIKPGIVAAQAAKAQQAQSA